MILNELVLLAAALIMFPVFLFVFVSELQRSSWNLMSFKKIIFIMGMASLAYYTLGVWL